MLGHTDLTHARLHGLPRTSHPPLEIDIKDKICYFPVATRYVWYPHAGNDVFFRQHFKGTPLIEKMRSAKVLFTDTLYKEAEEQGPSCGMSDVWDKYMNPFRVRERLREEFYELSEDVEYMGDHRMGRDDKEPFGEGELSVLGENFEGFDYVVLKDYDRTGFNPENLKYLKEGGPAARLPEKPDTQGD